MKSQRCNRASEHQQFAYLSCFSFLFFFVLENDFEKYIPVPVFTLFLKHFFYSRRTALIFIKICCIFCQTSCRMFSFLLIYGQTSSRHIRPDSTYLVSCIPRYSRYRYFHIIRYLHHDLKDNFNFISVRCGMKKSPTLGGAGETCQLLCCTA